ncbi:hypothetical protein NLG97_g325 [Lecanicillium saksenae]|uniref:Uncharacterized protein n=1 Tax=Lecanicillium saksenae TaxID=468837 RepID=A0ACC1RAA2_9HYPO|nr:hypothetical protein NLG97_g325 [Lecanicillium saksenae]
MALSNLTLDHVADLAGCDSATSFVIALKSSYADEPDGRMVLQTWALLNASGTDMGLYTMQDVQDWYRNFSSHRFESVWDDMQDRVIDNCHSVYCKKVPYSGNPDLGGIGVFTAYCIQLSLGGIFLVGMLVLPLLKPASQNSQSPGTSLAAALESTLCVFWDSSLLFSIGISIATLTLASQASEYSQYFLMPVTFTALLVPTVLWNVNAKVCSLRRCRRAALYLTMLLAMLATTWTSTAPVTGPDISDFELSCLQDKSGFELGLWAGFLYVQWGFCGLWFVNGVITLFNFPWHSDPRQRHKIRRRVAKALVLMAAPSFNPVRARHSKPDGGRRILALVLDYSTTLVLLAGIVFSFRSYTVVRGDFNATDQGRNDQQQWGFGQVLAVTAWIPTFLELYAATTTSIVKLKKKKKKEKEELRELRS